MQPLTLKAENTVIIELTDKTFSVSPLYDKLGLVNEDQPIHNSTI